MSRRPPLRRTDVVALRRLVSHGADERLALLRAAADRPIRAAVVLREWHDLLLFLLAHPGDAEEAVWATAQLDRIASRVAQLPERAQGGLLDSGLAGAPVEGAFSLPLVQWLMARWPGHVRLTQVDAPLDDVRDVLRALVLPAERETVDEPVTDAESLLALIFGDDDVRWLPLLLACFEALTVPDAMREQWFARLRAWVRIGGGAVSCAVTQARAPTAAPFTLPDGLHRGVDVAAVVAQPVPPPLRITPQAARALVDTARTVLATMARETDPVTHASAVTLHDMGRGLRIALFSLDVPHRLPFDSYVGFMAFRNGVPLAYGGAWIFPGRSKIGINVFPAQRGGESAWFFAQLLRLYRDRFRVETFEAENYQLGFHNPEGLRSGAYWFYFRLGFRPAQPMLQRVAEREFARLTTRRGYAVPSRVLRQLVEAGLELPVASSSAAAAAGVLDAGALTAAVSRHIVTWYAGDRPRALAAARRRVQALVRDVLPAGGVARWPAASRSMFEQWLPALDLVDDLETWTHTERLRLAAVIRSKGEADETRHQQRLRTHTRLLAGWARALSD
jgi:hypothetical protein